MFSKINRAFEKSRAEDGFTLIELLIVIVIIGILAAIAIPVFLNAQNAAHDATVKSDARNTVIGVATALVTKPDATGFMVLAPSDTTAAVKLAGVPSVVVTVPAGAVAVRGVVTQSNWVTVRGTGADYVVHAQSTVDGFWYEFKSKTGKYTSSSDTPAVTPGVPSSTTPVPNSVQSPNGIAVRIDGAPIATTDGTGGTGGGAVSGPQYPAGNYGIAFADFPTAVTGIGAKSGWDNRNIVTDGNATNSNTFQGGTRWSAPVVYTLGEPRIESNSLQTALYFTTVADDRGSWYYGNTSEIKFRGNTVSPPTVTSYATCGDAQYSPPTHTVPLDGQMNVGWANSDVPLGPSYYNQNYYLFDTTYSWYNNPANPNPSYCPFLQKITLTVGYYNWNSATMVNQQMTWNATGVRDQKLAPVVNYTQLICSAAADNVALTLRGCR